MQGPSYLASGDFSDDDRRTRHAAHHLDLGRLAITGFGRLFRDRSDELDLVALAHAEPLEAGSGQRELGRAVDRLTFAVELKRAAHAQPCAVATDHHQLARADAPPVGSLAIAGAHQLGRSFAHDAATSHAAG